MKGILARGSHHLAVTDSASAALALLRRNVRVDLVFTELKLKGDGGLSLIRQLRTNPLFKHVPVVVYTDHADRDAVKRALDLQVQNFRVKPFTDQAIFAEIERATETPWLAEHFEEEKSFCQLMELTPDQLRGMLRDVRTSLLAALSAIEKGARLRDAVLVARAVSPVRAKAEAAGAWGVVDALTQATDCAGKGAWSAWPSAFADLESAAEAVAHWLEPQREGPDFPAQDPAAPLSPIVRERAAWLAAATQGGCPLVTREQLQREIDALPGCPVIDSAAAAFQMEANGRPSCINPLMDLVARDPGLTTQMLIAANRAHPPADEFSRIEDARLAVGQLGEMRLQEEARRIAQIDQRIFSVEPGFSWAGYWTFQRGVARIAQLICRDLEFYSLEAIARTAGQLHDIGRLLLARLRPAGFQASIEHARVHRVSLREAERLFLGCTTPQLAAHFADRAGLSHRYAHVMRWIEDPGAATQDKHLVAIISLARDLCRQNQVGESGDPLLETVRPLEETAEWAILREGLYPSFNLKKFEQQVNAYCAQLRTEFSGHQSGTVAEIFAHAKA